VDAGDWAPDPAKPHEDAKFAFQLETMALMGYDAAGVGERELGFGYEKLQGMAAKSKTPILSSNLIDKKTGKPAFKQSVIVKKGGLKVGIFSVIGAKVELPAGSGEKLTIDDPIATAQKMVAELRKQADVVIALTHLGRVEGEDLAAQVPGIDVVILAHRAGFVAQGRRVNNAITVASGEQGQNVGLTKLALDGKKVTDLSSETLILLPEVGERADLAKLAKDFEDAQNALLQKEQQQSQLQDSKKQQPGGDQYVGSETCMSCHKPQFEQWQSTQHAHAFATLQRVQKDATPECVQCHVVGFQRPSGYVNAQTTGKLMNVGCESCHGYGTRHDMFAKDGGKVAEAVCITCHQPANDPGWNYAAKLPRVSH
jgi:Cytochrome c554 and c-prime